MCVSSCLLYRYLSLDSFPSVSGNDATCVNDNHLPRPCPTERVTPRHPDMAVCSGYDVRERERRRLSGVRTVASPVSSFPSAAAERGAARASAVGRRVRSARGIFQRGGAATDSVHHFERARSASAAAPRHPAALQIQVSRFKRVRPSLFV